jgi:hypothetical protein
MMETNSPHLPPKSCNIAWYRRLQSLPGFLVVLAITVLISLSVTLLVLNWFLPSMLFQGSTVLEKTSTNKPQVSSFVVRHVEERTIQLFDIRKKVGTFYNEDANVLDAAVLSSDGWAVAAPKNFVHGQQFFWEGVDFQGNSHAINKVVYDAFTGLLYIKFDVAEYRIFPFASWNKVEEPLSAIVSAEEIGFVEFNKPKRTSQKNIYQLSSIHHSYQTPAVTKAGIVVTEQGALLGLVSEEGKLIPSFWIEEYLPSVLEGKSLQYRGVSVYGMFVDVDLSENKNTLQDELGFYVTHRGSTTLLAGDIIKKINNQDVHTVHSLRHIFTSDDPVEVVITRGVEEKILSISKVRIR